jgi:DNA-binding transcriptional MocR family regulator
MDGFTLPTPLWSEVYRRIQAEYHAGWLPAKHRDVGLAIAHLNAAGDWTPTTRKIGIEAGCSERTVRRARATLEARGLLAVRARFEIVDGRAQQRSNEYNLTLPDAPLLPKPRQIRGGQTGRPNQGSKQKRLLRGWLDEPDRVAVDLLAARRAAVEASLRGKQVAT